MTHDEIIQRLEANGKPSIFEAETLSLIRQLENKVHFGQLSINRRQSRIEELERRLAELDKSQ